MPITETRFSSSAGPEQRQERIWVKVQTFPCQHRGHFRFKIADELCRKLDEESSKYMTKVHMY